MKKIIICIVLVFVVYSLCDYFLFEPKFESHIYSDITCWKSIEGHSVRVITSVADRDLVLSSCTYGISQTVLPSYDEKFFKDNILFVFSIETGNMGDQYAVYDIARDGDRLTIFIRRTMDGSLTATQPILFIIEADSSWRIDPSLIDITYV